MTIPEFRTISPNAGNCLTARLGLLQLVGTQYMAGSSLMVNAIYAHLRK